MNAFFAPMLMHIQQTLVDEKHAAEAAKRDLEWQNRDGRNADDIEKGLQVDKELEEACTMRCVFAEWRSQAEMCRAADYSDEVCVTPTGNRFRQFYCCRGRGSEQK